MPERDALDALFLAAREAQTRAYAPYSGFRVGAALRTPAGTVFTGCNVENAAYPVGTCAEAGAIAAMIAGGERAIAEILVIGDGDEPATPCGACRQRIGEFASAGALVHAGTASGVRARFTIGELLPHAFGPELLSAAPNRFREAGEP